jgi:Zn-finger nucleic acid-binding protein
MDCPACKNAMIILELNEVEIDFCGECGGVWLDAGELELFFDDPEKARKLISSFKTDSANVEKEHKCPICRKKMEKILCGPGENIRIDRCVRGHGLWFDRGELYDVIRAGQLGESSEVLGLIKDMLRAKIDHKED